MYEEDVIMKTASQAHHTTVAMQNACRRRNTGTSHSGETLFLNFIFIHPYVDFNRYKNKFVKNYGFKFKIRFGQFPGLMMTQ
jgi:hypothetical protein